MKPALYASSAALLLLLGATATTHAASAPDGPTEVHRYALVIGTNDGGPGRAQLRYAVTDAQAFGTVLSQLGGVAAADQIVLAEASRSQVLAGLDTLAAKVRSEPKGKRTQLVVYYSGHADEYGLLLGAERLSFKTLRDRIEAMPVDVKIAVVDSCASGALLRAKGGKHVPPFLVDASNDVTGHAFLTSSSAHEVAQESDRLGGSFFTHHLVSGLRGAADMSGDGRVTLNEAYQFAFAGTLAHTERTRVGAQHPNYDFDLSGSGDIVITDVRQMTSRLVLGGELVGRFFIRDSHDRLIAEVDKVAGRQVELGIESGAYRVTTVRDSMIYAATIALASGHETILIAGTLAPEGPALTHRTRGGELTLPPMIAAPDAVISAEPAPREGTVLATDPADASVIAFRFGVVPGVGFPMSSGPVIVKGANIGLLGDSVYRVDGAQVSGIVNISDVAVDGAQVAGVVNITRRLDGVQVAGVLNIADDVKGAQISGVINHADDVRGAQIGLINIAGHVRGAQIGLINVADSVDGVSLGLIPIIADGYNHLEVYGDSSLLANVAARFGAPYLHAIISAGVSGLSDPDTCVLRLGAGLGTHIDLGGPVYLDLDLSASGIAAKGCDFSQFADDELLGQARATVGVSLTSALAIFVGAAANGEVALTDNDLNGPLLVGGDRRRGEDWEAEFFPSFYAGVRLF